MKVAAALPLLAVGASAFAPAPASKAATTALSAADNGLYAEVGGEKWDPLSLYGLEDAADTFPNMFPKGQFLEEAEIKHGRMSMLAWTGVWATHVGGLGLGMHIPGFPVESDWTKALGVFAAEQPAWFAGILLFIAICEGESVGHSGDNFRGMGTKTPGDMGFDPWGLKAKLSEEKQARYKVVELKNGRAAMIAMASLFAFESIPGSVPLMDVFGAQ
uniref:Plastid light harvesting protein n=1 Tax=Pseudictyota dubia TaxID=2749911 RepID=A0A7R9VUS2_9STRA